MVTEQDAKQAAEQGLIPAIKCSIEHHKDPGRMTSLGLQVAIKDGRFKLGPITCALCCFGKKGTSVCGGCPLRPDFGPTECCAEYVAVKQAYDMFGADPSNANYAAFIKAEAKMVERLEKELAKAEAEEMLWRCKDCKHQSPKGVKNPCYKCRKNDGFEPKEKKIELRHGDYGYFDFKNWSKKEPSVYINHNSTKDTVYHNNGMICSSASKGGCKLHVIGNIFDDLADDDELEEFELKLAHDDFIKIYGNASDEGIVINIGKEGCGHVFDFDIHVTPEQAQKIGQYLIKKK